MVVACCRIYIYLYCASQCSVSRVEWGSQTPKGQAGADMHTASPPSSAHAKLHEGASVRPAQARRQDRPKPGPRREHTARRLLVRVQAEAKSRLREHLRSRAW